MGENNKTNKAYRAYGMGFEHKLAGITRKLGMINTVFSGGKLRKTARPRAHLRRAAIHDLFLLFTRP